jgi:uncharacterized membrane protein
MDDKAFTELLKARKKQVDDLRDLDDASKAKARDLYDQALQEMEKATASAARVASFEQRTALAPAELCRRRPIWRPCRPKAG